MDHDHPAHEHDEAASPRRVLELVHPETHGASRDAHSHEIPHVHGHDDHAHHGHDHGHGHANDHRHSHGHGHTHGHGHGHEHGHGHGHGHSHGHGHGHSHGPSPTADPRVVLLALVLLTLFMAGELVTALASGSMALLSDAGHMLSDVLALAGALWAMRLATRPPGDSMTFGLKRAEILSAAINGIMLLVVGGVVGAEAIDRLASPEPVEGGPVLVVAMVGVAVNIIVAWLVARADRSSLNVEGAYQHILTDLFGFIGTIIAGLWILFTHQTIADPIVSLAVVFMMLRAGWGLVQDAGRILLEGAPHGVDVSAIRARLLATAHVQDVHDLHVWTVTSGLPVMSAHLVVEDGALAHRHGDVLAAVQDCLRTEFDVAHSTFQLESAADTNELCAHACEPPVIRRLAGRHRGRRTQVA